MNLQLPFKKIKPEIKYILKLFIITRIVLTLIGFLARQLLPPFTYEYHAYSSYNWLNIWSVWDSAWYIDIALNGYTASPMGEDATHVPGTLANYGFFPLYPLLMRIGGDIIGNTYISGLIISNISLLIAAYFLYKLVESKKDNSTALRSTKYLFLFPTAFILSGVFSESLFLALSLACFYYVKEKKWLIVGILGFFVSLTRYLGVLILIPLVYEYFKEKKFKLKETKANLIFLLFIPLGIISFFTFNYFLTGDFFAYINIHQTGWGQQLTNPLKIITQGITSQSLPIFWNTILALSALTCIVISYKKIRFSYWLLAFYSILIPLSSGIPSLFGMGRFLLVIFPLFMLCANLTKKKEIDIALSTAFIIIQIILMILWTTQSIFTI